MIVKMNIRYWISQDALALARSKHNNNKKYMPKIFK